MTIFPPSRSLPDDASPADVAGSTVNVLGGTDPVTRTCHSGRRRSGDPAAEGTCILNLRLGQRLHCQVCSASVIVVRAKDDPVDLQCDGQPLAAELPSVSGSAAPSNGSGSVMGKRYTDAANTLELLCVRSGAGTLTVAGEPLQVKASKALPASD